MNRLNPEILEYLSKELSLSESSVRQYLSGIKLTYKDVTLNAAAQIFASQRGKSVRRMLDREDKSSLPSMIISKSDRPIVIKKKNKHPIINFFKYETDVPFIKGHIEEVNKAYTSGCYTCVFILCRKIIENLIIDILEDRFPKERTLYWDSGRYRYLDFSIVLENLFKKRLDFEPSEVKTVERLYNLAKPFKDDCNDKTHSWVHLVKRKKEIDDVDVGTIIDLIKLLEV